ncbi:MAG: cytochrome C biogenesis protein CycH [Deltaproteobacteria bacterium RBG_16_58_17]|nr:MAG: cytochrome C biogenesis protein CycH [Deltaproteobacteria bacterium RBG_16_58_17]OHE16261.1 MAG: cytochrome C biogenesis protein CycH [Syntrophobacterales bacterium GWC2_56_13]OHE20406.1 MAG: cytochrome C biogenesis protein CycH [Syntrophobacterales bacterium GWF2_56_9]
MKEEPRGEIVIYRAKDGKAALEVKLKEETVWLSQAQMGQLFDKNKRTISEHINNLFREGELIENTVVRNFRTTAADGKSYQVEYYNLDVIISVGYRVKSQRGTQFRIWATQVLKDHILKGYSINEKRLQEQNARFLELQKTVGLMQRVMEGRELARDEATGLLQVITDYSYALSLLDQYDHQQLKIRHLTKKKPFFLTYEAARRAIDKLGEQSKKKGRLVTLFGREKDQSFKGSLGAIYQTFDGKEVYPSIEEKAAHLLYFVVKNHSFIDGNKRIGAFLFIWFLDAGGILYAGDGSKRIGDNALVALTLMIAESRPEDKDIIIKVIVNLINRDNI